MKEFNVTGICRPAKHYMADVSQKLKPAINNVERGKYFSINRPRQFGKTTMLYSIAAELEKRGGYLVFNTSFEGLGDSAFKDEESVGKAFLGQLADYATIRFPDLAPFIKQKVTEMKDLATLSLAITDIVNQSEKKIVVIIDEVDSASNNEVFVRFLAMLRKKYLEQDVRKTFHSIVLAGLYDIKSLKLKIKNHSDTESKYNSPWNIATDFKVNMHLLPHEVKPMLDDYVQERGVKMDTQALADELFYYTSGYPFLTSQLCKLIDEEILPEREAQEWTKADVFKAFQMLIRIPNVTNFDSLFKHLREFPDLYRLVYNLIIEGETYPFNIYDETVNLGVLHGIFTEGVDGKLKIHNRIYRELIAEVMVSEWRTKKAVVQESDFKNGFMAWGKYRLPNNGLDVKALVEGFQAFMKLNHSERSNDMLERDGRLVFLAYLKPIINGSGFDFKEPQVSEEKRLDVVITFFQHWYLIELKIWRGEAAHQEGLIQLADYLDRIGLDTGYLVIFDNNKTKTWGKDWTEVNGKRIYWVKV
jgi:AAA+ ATPase superfamily predicted ATPase